MKQILLCMFLAAIMVACRDQGVPPEPPVPPIVSGPPQWAMFHHDSRHTGNVHTPLYDGVGPAGDSVTVSWRVALDLPVWSTPAVGSDGTIYVGTRKGGGRDSGSVYAITKEGSVKWRYSQIGSVLSSPALGDDGSVYVGGSHGLYAFTPSGTLKWKHADPYATVESSPAIGDDGTVYYASDALKAIDPQTGSLKWQVAGGDYINSPSIGTDGTIYYSNRGTITAVTPGGEVKWRYNDSTYGPNVWALTVAHDGTVCFGSDASPYLYMIDSLGHLKAKIQVQGLGGTQCLDEEGFIYVVSSGELTLMYLSPGGELMWQAPLHVTGGQLNVDLNIDGNGIVCVGVSDDPGLVALEAFRKTTLLWQFGSGYPDNGRTMAASPVVANGSVYFGWAYGPPYLYALR
jgi:outer membrane protein assembly factor BamB